MNTLYDYWLDERTQYTIEGARRGLCPSAIEIHSFSTISAPEMMHTVVLQEGETGASIWQRAIEVMLELKRMLPLNVSVLPHGIFHFRYGGPLNVADVESNNSYRNRRFWASWAACNRASASARHAGRVALREMVDGAVGPSLERVLAHLELASLSGLLSRDESRSFLEWAEKQRLATPLHDVAGQDAIGSSLARHALVLLEAKESPVATLQ